MESVAMIKAVIFIIFSAGIFWFSRASMRRPDSHGFYRFFAFEALLGLALLNLDRWFADPFSSWQILSWPLLLASVMLALHGFLLLQKIGRPQGSFENTTQLVTLGAYRWIRHPLYASLILFALGTFFKAVTLPAAALLGLVIAFLYGTARVEERENLDRFGEAYADYMQRSKMFIPYLF